MKEEVKRILKMVEDGKVDLDKASELIDALYKSDNETPLATLKNLDKMLKVRVMSSTKDTVNVNVPVKFLKAIGNAVNNIKIPGISDENGIDIKMIMKPLIQDLKEK